MANKKKALFVGLTGIDYVYYLDSFPTENGKCKTNDYAKYIGGPAANAAITYAALGGDATLITAIGKSLESKFIEEEMKRFGVKLVNVACDNKLPGTSTIFITEEGKRTIVSGQNNYCELDLKSVETEGYDFALFDCNQQDVSLEILERISCEIVLDAGNYKPNVERFLEKARVVISSEQFRDAQGRDIFQMNYSNIELRAMTRGEKAVLSVREHKSNNAQGYEGTPYEILVDQVDCIDSLAAGDIFHGAFCYAYYEKENSFEDSLVFASGVASESVKYRGPREWQNSYC